jgi:hypothetical protein
MDRVLSVSMLNRATAHIEPKNVNGPARIPIPVLVAAIVTARADTPEQSFLNVHPARQ